MLVLLYFMVVRDVIMYICLILFSYFLFVLVRIVPMIYDNTMTSVCVGAFSYTLSRRMIRSSSA